MRYSIIATGSKGNCLLVHDVPALVDLGVSFKVLKGYLPEFRDSAPGVFLTHKHGDHFNGATARALILEHPGTMLFTPEKMTDCVATAVGDRYLQNIMIVKSGIHYRISNGQYGVEFFAQDTYHDAPNVCWHIFINDTKCGKTERIFYATDTGHLEGIKARNYDYYFIEGNHTVSEIEERAWDKIVAGEYSYEIRAAKNHLSVEQAMDFIAENAGPESKYILIHQHLDK